MATIQDILAAAVGGGDRRLMRGSTAMGGRPSASFRKETQDAMQRKTDAVMPTTDLQGQLALNQAALSGADYVSADAINDYIKYPGTETVIGKRTTDPIANPQTVQRSTDYYNTKGFQSPINWEAPTDDRGNPVPDMEGYYDGPSGRPDGWETRQQQLARKGPEGEPGGYVDYGFVGGMTPYSTGFDRMGNERPISSFPMPTYESQFQAYPGQAAGDLVSFNKIVDVMNPYNPSNDEAMSHHLFRMNQSGGFDPYNDMGMGIPLTVSQLNARRAANAIAARNHYNRYWATMKDPMSYIGGY